MFRYAPHPYLASTLAKEMKKENHDERFPVWDALSEFFLDTELDEKDYDRISSVLAASDYSIRQIEEILFFEVYPACKWNMCSIAGEWAGFHPEWIEENIGRRKDKRRRFRLSPFSRWMYSRHWKAVAKAIGKKRANEPTG